MEELAADGVPVAAFEDKPVADKAQAYYLEVFYDLTDSRRFTHGSPVAIPISEILAYCQMFSIDSPEERHSMLKMVQTLDNTYLKVSNEQAKEAEKKADKPDA